MAGRCKVPTTRRDRYLPGRHSSDMSDNIGEKQTACQNGKHADGTDMGETTNVEDKLCDKSDLGCDMAVSGGDRIEVCKNNQDDINPDDHTQDTSKCLCQTKECDEPDLAYKRQKWTACESIKEPSKQCDKPQMLEDNALIIENINNEEVSRSNAPSPITEHAGSRDETQSCINRHIQYKTDIQDFTKFDIGVYIFSIISYICDIGSDIWICYMYYSKGDTWWFRLTLVFIILPSVTMSAFSLRWYILDYKHDKHHHTCIAWFFRWLVRIIFLSIHLAPVLRFVWLLYFISIITGSFTFI